ncbi:hypothetical protein MG293_006369, partial [Ovis ammon polii]
NNFLVDAVGCSSDKCSVSQTGRAIDGNQLTANLGLKCSHLASQSKTGSISANLRMENLEEGREMECFVNARHVVPFDKMSHYWDSWKRKNLDNIVTGIIILSIVLCSMSSCQGPSQYLFPSS